MSTTRLFAVAFFTCAALASVSHADSVEYQFVGGGSCSFGMPGHYLIVATLNLSAPARALQVSTATWCGNFIGGWQYPVSGDPYTMLTVDFGGCINGSVLLFTAQFDYYGACCPPLLRGPATGGHEVSPPVLIGCDDQPRFLIPPCSAGSPALLTPPDSAIGVPLTPSMSWSYSCDNYCDYGTGLNQYTVQYGVDPGNLDQSFSTVDYTEGTLPELEPNTQYFWRVKVLDDWAPVSGSAINFSEVRSFTTGGGVPTRSTTWGKVKALYKE